jgi:uncharacterized protein
VIPSDTASAYVLWTSADHAVPASISARFPWLDAAYREFNLMISGADLRYPCHFGVRGQREGRNAFTAIDSSDGEAGVAALAGAIRAFQRMAWNGPKRQSLIAFAGPVEPSPDLGNDTRRFWELLSALTAVDELPWPAEYPADVTDPKWQWCFGGEPWFVFGCSPAYLNRRSRNVGPCLTLVFQVRRVFDGLSGSSAAGQAAKRMVRAGLARYDATAPHPHLGDDQHSSVFKWRQYMLPDDDSVLAPGACPFRQPPAGGPASRRDLAL